ncbi:38471_t:CDS:1, partial [Gigaspora margarita]
MVADSIRYKLNEYWSLLDEKITIAAILDPSPKLKTFPPGEKRTAAIANLRQEMVHYKSLTSEVNTNLTTSKNKKAYFESFFAEEQETEQPPEEELDLYLALPICKNDSGNKM